MAPQNSQNHGIYIIQNSKILSFCRSVDQFAEQRKHVLELKNKNETSASGRTHFINKGQIVNMEAERWILNYESVQHCLILKLIDLWQR